MAKILVVLCLLLTSLSIFGQDIHYSQYFNCPLSLNPAETGIFDGDWRGIVNYRNQWSSLGIPYNTLSASYDQQLYIKNHHFSPGLYVMSDNSDNAILKVTMVYGSFSYHENFHNNSISLGIQIGAVNKNVDFSKLTLPNQYDPNDLADNLFNPSILPIGISKDNITYLDMNVGAAWSRKIKKFEPEVGISFFHLNHPQESFYDEPKSRAPVRSTFYAAVKTDINQNVYMKPGVMFFSISGSSDMMIGSQIGFVMQGNSFNVSNAYGGVYLRNGIINQPDAIMLMLGAQVHSLNIAISYDVNVSSLSTFTNHQGAFEISLIYKSISTIIKTFTIPCERI